MKLDICLVCGSKNTFELYPSTVDLKKLSFTYVKTPDSGKTFRSVRCKNCTHVFCNPLPKNIYKNYEDVVDKQYLKYTDSIIESAKKILPIIKSYIKSGKMLDVGCATGEFLDKAREYGYEVEGLELSRWSSEIAEKKKIKIHRSLLNSLSKKFPNRYDVITLFGVIEHFENPALELQYIVKLLKPGGLVVIWTGDVNSFSSKLFGYNWWYWQGQHIQYFTHKSLALVAIKSGIKHLFTKTYPFVATYSLLNNSLSRYKTRHIIMKLIKPFFLLKARWILYIPGEMLWFGIKSSKISKRKKH